MNNKLLRITKMCSNENLLWGTKGIHTQIQLQINATCRDEDCNSSLRRERELKFKKKIATFDALAIQCPLECSCDRAQASEAKEKLQFEFEREETIERAKRKE